MKLFQLLMILFIPFLFYVVSNSKQQGQFSILHIVNKKADIYRKIIGVLKGRTEYE